ncbi:MAG: transposase [Paraglaciecola sp.]|uniref:REP-associated tyrosine transposase n=1 Tax=Rheinheimera baltica TaxID=67576 RepID=UPI00273ED61E|nr:transposase [Rheinheimera baltica]MDP5132877.1 transposase [Paraglaciecola sp.]MDP5189536.1 transposase [Rheinheimera baltica]
MARPLRLEFAGALYHITSRGNERKAIYFDDTDFELFLTLLGKVCEQYNWVVNAYCLMTNHYHLLVETPDANLSKGMRQLNGTFTQAINRKHQRVGHLFQGRYKAILVDKNTYLLELSRYIVLNPIRANMVQNLEDWPWSNWQAVMGKAASPAWLATVALLSLFSKQRKTAREKYAAFVQQGKGVPVWDKLSNQIFLGSDDFVQNHLTLLNEPDKLADIPKKQRRGKAQSLTEYEHAANTRNDAIVTAYRSGSYTLKEIGNHFGLHYSRVSKIVAKSKT